MKISLQLKITMVLLVALACNPTGSNASSLVLKNAFIEHVKNRVTIDVKFNVDHAAPGPHRISSGGNDGDLHMAGRAVSVGLPLVVEIVNAGEPSQNSILDDAEESNGGKSVDVSGAWRVWFEHPGGDQIQGEDVPVPSDTNPDHVFEIHPVTQFAGNSAVQSFVPIPGYQAYDAETAFSKYEKITATIQSMNTSTTIDSPKAGYNYTDFIMQLAEDPTPSDDGGLLVLADVVKDDEEMVVPNPHRMVFAPNTPPAKQVAGLHKGDKMHVLGIPRVNLERISVMTAEHPGEEFEAQLPYEMIIVAVYQDGAAASPGVRARSPVRGRPARPKP